MTADLFPEMQRNRTKLEVWKERHNVATEFCHLSQYWEAFFMVGPDARGDEAVAETEEEACLEFAKKWKLPFLESITQADMERMAIR